MTTYNTYQEAKIANPCDDICVINKCEFQSEKETPLRCDIDEWKLCNPADYCMTVEQFLKAGHKFKVGDLYLSVDGCVITTVISHFRGKTVSAYDLNNSTDMTGADKCFILRAAALEEKPKRVKVEYVKVDLSLIEKIEIVKSGERLYLNRTGSTWICESDIKSWEIGSLEKKDFYRQVKTEISERDEFAMEFVANIDSECEHEKAQARTWALDAFDSGKFKLVEGE